MDSTEEFMILQLLLQEIMESSSSESSSDEEDIHLLVGNVNEAGPANRQMREATLNRIRNLSDIEFKQDFR